MIGDEGLFLDDMTLAEVRERLGVPVFRSGYTPSEFLEGLSTAAGARGQRASRSGAGSPRAAFAAGPGRSAEL
jgi:hypothetical protein